MSVENPNFGNEPASPESERGMPTLKDNKKIKEGLGKKFEGVEIPKAINESMTMQETREDLYKSYNGEKHKERQNEGPAQALNKEMDPSNVKELKKAVESIGSPKKWWQAWKK